MKLKRITKKLCCQSKGVENGRQKIWIENTGNFAGIEFGLERLYNISIIGIANGVGTKWSKI
jgi:hypothetical protein